MAKGQKRRQIIKMRKAASILKIAELKKEVTRL